MKEKGYSKTKTLEKQLKWPIDTRQKLQPPLLGKDKRLSFERNKAIINDDSQAIGIVGNQGDYRQLNF